MDDLLREFLTETNESLDVVDVELVRFEQDPNNVKILGNIFRLVHTIKGTCGFIGLPRLATLAHAAESLMGKFRDGMPVTSDAVTLILATIDRIKEILDAIDKTENEPQGSDDDLIAKLADMGTPKAVLSAPAPITVGSLTYQVLERPLKPGEVSLDELERAFREAPGPAPVAAQAAEPRRRASDREEESTSKNGSHSIRVNVDTLESLMTMVSELVLTRNQLLEMSRRQEDSEFKAPLQRLSNVTAELQDSVMKTRMQPVGNAWQKLPRIIRDLSAELGKHIELEMHGAETELDRQVLDRIRDPLTHMVRNSADHGLESPEERAACGKPRIGTIRLTACHEGGQIIIEVADDGRGLDTKRIKSAAVAKGLATEADLATMTDAQIHRFVFAPGFSTAAQVTNVSGRGVGMDVVHTNIDQIGGSVDVKSVAGEGSVFTIKIPLTLAIISALIIESAGERFAIPQLAVTELVRVKDNSDHRIERIKDTPVLRLRNRLLPLVHLGQLLRIDARPDKDAGTGFIVVMQIGSHTFGVVVDGVFHTEEIVVKPMATRLRHIPVFSGNTILGDGAVIMIIDPNGIAQSIGAASAQSTAAIDVQTATPERPRTSVLLFRAGSHQLKAVPLSLVTRLEEIDVEKIELSNGRELVQYRGQLMPLIRMNDHVRIKDEGTQPLLVFSDGARSMALVVDEIVDIVDDYLDIQPVGGGAGIIGSSVIKGQATEVIDIAHFMPLAFADWFKGGTSRKDRAAMRLLLVDDSDFFRNMLVPVLSAAGYDVTQVQSVSDALTTLRKNLFDVIVTDIDMPGMDGAAFANSIKSDAQSAHIPIIALSSTLSAETIERVRQAGIHDFVAKFDRQGLIASLKEQTADIHRAA